MGRFRRPAEDVDSVLTRTLRPRSLLAPGRTYARCARFAGLAIAITVAVLWAAAPRGGGTSPPEDDPNAEAKLQLLIAEYNFVTGLIPFYRSVEMRALGGTGVVLSAVAGAFGAFESAKDPSRPAEGILLAIAALVPALLLLVEVMALTRLRRASLYISKRLHPLAGELTGNDPRLLRWELEPTEILLEQSRAVSTARFGRIAGPGATKAFVSSAPIIVLIALTTFLLAGAGYLVNPVAATAIIGAIAIVLAAISAFYGLAFTSLHEGRTSAGKST
jgi:hypothetical protein